MKTFLLLFLFITSLLASDLESIYKKTNQEIDKLAPQLSVQEKVTLYYLVMSTYSKILTSTPYNAIREQTLKSITKLHESKSKIPSQEIKNLHILYTTLITTSLKSQKIKKEIVYKEKIVSKSNLASTIVTTIISLSLGLILGIFFFNKKRSYSQQSDKSIQIINELENKNRELEQQITTMQKVPKNDVNIKDAKTDLTTLLEQQNITLSGQNSELQTTLKKLESEYNKLSQEQMSEIQHLNEYVASLKNELAKYESSLRL